MKRHRWPEHGTSRSEGVHGFGPRTERRARPTALRRSLLLLVSENNRLHQQLRAAANAVGRWVVCVHGPAAAVANLQVFHPAAVVLDLSGPEPPIWETLHTLMQCPDCPPMLLLQCRDGHCEVWSTVRQASLSDPAEVLSHLV